MLTINNCFAQEKQVFKAGINLFGNLTNAADIKIEYFFSPYFTISLSGGHQWPKNVPNSGNSTQSKASGGFIRFGTKFLTSKIDKPTRFYINANLIYSSVGHKTIARFRNIYENFELPFINYSKHLGPSFGVGIQHIVYKKWEIDYSLNMGFPNNSENYMFGGYILPGYYFGYQPMKKHTNIYIIPLIMLQYKFMPTNIDN